MFDKFTKLRSVLTALILLAAVVLLLTQTNTTRVTASNNPVSVIVELRDDPGAIYKARIEKSGGVVSSNALQAYRDQLLTKQDAFLSALGSSGISYSVISRNVKNYDGSVAAAVKLRYTLAYNGLALSVAPDAVNAIKAMPQVKGIYPDAVLHTMLNYSVDYIHAPQVYGKYQELTQYDNFREGYEGQGINIAIIDTGVDWTHPMFGGDPTPPRLGVAPPTPAATSTNQKVIYYLPLTDIAANDGFGHGTHVGSTAAGYLALHPGADGVPNTADDIRLHALSFELVRAVQSSSFSLSLAKPSNLKVEL